MSSPIDRALERLDNIMGCTDEDKEHLRPWLIDLAAERFEAGRQAGRNEAQSLMRNEREKIMVKRYETAEARLAAVVEEIEQTIKHTDENPGWHPWMRELLALARGEGGSDAT